MFPTACPQLSRPACITNPPSNLHHPGGPTAIFPFCICTFCRPTHVFTLLAGLWGARLTWVGLQSGIPKKGITYSMLKMFHFMSLFSTILAHTPFHRNMQVTEEHERMCPPTGFRAPPAMKVIVALWLAQKYWMPCRLKGNISQGSRLDLICKEHCDLQCIVNEET